MPFDPLKLAGREVRDQLLEGDGQQPHCTNRGDEFLSRGLNMLSDDLTCLNDVHRR